MTASLRDRSLKLVQELGLGEQADVGEVVPLTGGVASDIASVEVNGRKICVKFALPKLKVAAEWNAPVHRNAAEYAWLEVAAQILSDHAVELYGRSESLHGFAMEFVAGGDVYLWKAAMLRGDPPQGEAALVGDMLGRIHKGSAEKGFDVSPFQNRDDFYALRIEPYLIYAATQNPEVATELTALAGMLYAGQNVLVHGDVSPKNILLRAGAPIILDAECATMGDASFDPAFCLNHLVLKAVHLKELRSDLLPEVGAFWRAYSAHVDWEDATELERRLCRLLPALMLGRVDGKSPVEYLSNVEQNNVREIAISMLQTPTATLTEFVEKLARKLKELDA
ncbi:phosphotransferase family protein [Falsihalocynthiibacter sp. SS001]|uniref:phosphotransferase family protein n=1 Tax=Falsihalocynthiibacter sp. SS001 TaxID=3349698 RepID=UPI0036D3516E